MTTCFENGFRTRLQALAIKQADVDMSRASEYVGAGAAGLGAAGVMATGVGKAGPSFIDLAHQMFVGPNGNELFDALANTDAAGAARLKLYATKYPSVFKMGLLGIKIPGVDANTQFKLREYAFGVRPDSSRLGDVMVSAPTNEITSFGGRLAQTLSGNALHHSAIGMPSNMNSWAFHAGRNQGVQFWKGNLSDVPGATTVLRPRHALNTESLTGNIDTSFSEPYSYARLRRLEAQELLSAPWSDKASPTVTEKFFNFFNHHPTLRRWANKLPAFKDQIVAARLANRLCQGHVCSTAIADALQKTNPEFFKGKNPLGVAPGDFLRNVGKDFDVAALNLPSKLTTKPQLLLNHMMKAAPLASRALVAAPLIGAGAYMYNKASQPSQPDSWMTKLKQSLPTLGWKSS